MIITPDDEMYGNPVDNEKKAKLLSHLQDVFRDGYRPARGDESYSVYVGNYVKAFQMVNCLGHVFNLTNKQLEDYDIIPCRLYSYFPGIKEQPQAKREQRLLDFIQATGLQVQDCAPDKNIKDFNTWKIAMYFENNPYSKDFHFLLEEAPGFWSSKIGYSSYLEHIYTKEPPVKYAPMADNRYQYEYRGTYQITNPYASPNNKYLKKVITPDTKKRSQCIIQGKEADNYSDTYEPILNL